MQKQDINNEADLLARKRRLEKLKKKYEYKTTTERLKPFYIIFLFIGVFLQILSALFASGGVLKSLETFSESFIIVASITVFGLTTLEVLKRLAYSNYNTQRVNGEGVSKTTAIFCLLFGSASIFSSYKFAPYTVDYLAAAPELIDTSFINLEFKAKLAANVSNWEKLIKDSQSEAREIKSDNTNSEGVIYWHSLDNLDELKDQQKSYKDSLVKYSSIIKADQRAAIAQANKDNKEIKASSKSWVLALGAWAALLSLVFEVVVFLIIYWCTDFDTREIDEAETLPKDDQKSVITVVKEVVKETGKKVLNAPAEPSLTKKSIQIAQGKDNIKDENKDEPKEGDIVAPIGKQKTGRIYVSLDDGERLVLCRPSELRNYIRGNDEERAEYFKEQLLKLENWNNENKKQK